MGRAPRTRLAAGDRRRSRGQRAPSQARVGVRTRIRHAGRSPSPVGSIAVSMVEATLGRGLVPPPRLPLPQTTALTTTRVRAVRLPSIASAADGEQRLAQAATRYAKASQAQASSPQEAKNWTMPRRRPTLMASASPQRPRPGIRGATLVPNSSSTLVLSPQRTSASFCRNL